MTGPDEPDGPRAVHLATVQAWPADLGGVGGVGDVVVLALGAEGVALPPILVPRHAVAGLAAVLLQAAGLDGERAPSAPPAGAGGRGATVGGEAWAVLLAVERTPAAALDRSTIPGGAGVYAWFRDGAPIHLGRAVGKRGLRAAVGGDALRGDADRSRRPFRSAVAGHLGLGLGPTAGGDGDRLDGAEVAALDAWIDGCEVAWSACAGPAAAVDLEAVLRAEHDPALGT